MGVESPDIVRFLETVHPYDSLPREELTRAASRFVLQSFSAGNPIYALGDPLPGLFLIMEGTVEVRDPSDTVVSELAPRNSFGERGLLRDGRAATSTKAATDVALLMLPTADFKRLMNEQPVYARFFTRGRVAEFRRADMTVQKVGDLMSRPRVKNRA